MRVRSFQRDAAMPVNIWGERSASDGVVYTAALPPGPAREAATLRLRETLARRARGLDVAADELRTLVCSHEPVELISSVAIPTSMSVVGQGLGGDAGDTVTWPAKVEYPFGVALSAPAGSGSTPPEVTDRVMTLIDDIFDAARFKHVADSLDAPATGVAGLDAAVFMLRDELIIDRMPGYALHLQEIDTEVFARHRDFYLDVLGFSPDDVARVVRAKVAVDGQRANEALKRTRREHKRDKEQAALAMLELVQILDASRKWSITELALDVDIDATQLRAMLSFFSTYFGAQPGFRLPTDKNLARTRPCVELESGLFFVVDPWTLLGAVHLRLTEAVAAEPQARLARYRAHREGGHQRVVGNSFRHVFGHERVLETQHYVSAAEGPGEIDVLVATDWPLIVEAKAHNLTEPGRRGAPARVTRVANDVVGAALQQTRRARTYILDESGRDFGTKQGGPAIERLRRDPPDVTEIVVTFERMDPLVMHGNEVVGQGARPVWIVCLADLLMARDILVDPGALHHYARIRASMAIGGLMVFMEADALGAYLIDRIAPLRERAAEASEAKIFLEYTSDALNEYFTTLELQRQVKRPSTGVPTEVTAALTATASSDGCWWEAADAVMGASPDIWRRWKSFTRRHRQGVFRLSDAARLVSGQPSLSCRGACLELSVQSKR